MLKLKAAALAVTLLAFAAAPLAAQTDDDDDELSGGALAVLLLAVGGAVPTSSELKPQLKAALERYRVPYSEAQLASLSEKAAKQIKAQRKSVKEYKVCADGGKPCVRIDRQ